MIRLVTLFIITLTLSLKGITLQAQNLVKNSSFEEYTSCPNEFSELTHASRWFPPSAGTPDYFNACSNSEFINVPGNGLGNQQAKTGNAYAGFYAYHNNDYREYISIKLSDTLKTGKLYYFKMNLSLAGRCAYATDDIQVYFSSAFPYFSTSSIIPVTPQFFNTSGNMLQDTTEWMLITFAYTANGDEQYITIGNFKEDNSTTLSVVDTGSTNMSSYYYIDDVSLVATDYSTILENDTTFCANLPFSRIIYILGSQISNIRWNDGDSAEVKVINKEGTYFVSFQSQDSIYSDTVVIKKISPPDVFIGNDTSICPHTTLTLLHPHGYCQQVWQDLSTGDNLLVTLSGTYSLSVTDTTGCIGFDTILVDTFTAPVVDLGEGTFFCHPGTFLTSKGSFPSYLWQDYSTHDSLWVTLPGVYSLKVIDIHGCFGVDTIRLDTFTTPVFSLGNDLTFCYRPGIFLKPNRTFNAYLWQDGSTQPSYEALISGTYTLTVTDQNGCRYSDTVGVTVFPLPLIPLDSSYLLTPSLILDAGNNRKSYLWQGTISSQTYSVTEPGTYTITITDSNNCSASKSINVYEEMMRVFVPNAFSPNSDGINDVLFPVLTNVVTFDFHIYNRWGMEVFTTIDQQTGWDGKYKGEFLACDVYFYTLTCKRYQRIYNQKGTITILK